MSLSKAELTRYSRHIKLNKVGIDGQEKLKAAKVLVIGAGGLGCPVLQYLTAAGVGTLGIVDGDTVDESNLQRQILFTQADLKKPKAKTAALKLKQQNKHVNFKVVDTHGNKENIIQLISNFDIVVDCTDNFPTRYLINDACILENKPLVFGAIHQFEGQISVFNYQDGPSYRCIFPEASDTPNCAETGVLGVLPGIIGTFQANEVLKLILDIGDVLKGKLLTINALNYQMSIVEFDKTESSNITRLGSYDLHCKPTSEKLPKSISAKDFAEMINSGQEIQIVDVREYFEWDICHIEGALNIPMNLIDECMDEISKDVNTIVMCHHGVRSMNVIHYLEVKGYNKLINLEGGIHAWATEIDENMATY